MPIFEYSCDDCAATFERLEWRREASEPAACPSCGSLRTERQVSTFAARGTGSRTVAGSSCASGSGFR